MIIGLTAYARSGKDTVANYLVEQFGFVRMAFADGVREMAAAIDPYVNCDANRPFTEGDTPFARYSDTLRYVGYETAKTYSDVRRFLQRLGTEGVRGTLGDSMWLDLVARKIANAPNTNIVITDVRFENEARFIKEMGGFVVRLVRPGFGRETGHASETEMEAWPEDYCIEAETLDVLQSETERMASMLLRLQEDHSLPPVIAATRVYIGAPWVRKAEAAWAKSVLQQAGLVVVSTWTEQPDEDAPNLVDKAKRAESDWDELTEADAFVLLSLEKSSGKETELGGALMAGKDVIVVGDSGGSNVFYNHPRVTRVDTLSDAIILLGGNPPNVQLIPVRRDGDNVVAVETGQVVATKLGTVSSEDTPAYTAMIHSVENITDEGIKPRRLGVLTDVKE